MSVKIFCPYCASWHEPHNSIEVEENKELHNDLLKLHRNCDPCDMTTEDEEIWVKWDKVFNPQNWEV